MLKPLSYYGILGMGEQKETETYQQKAVSDMYTRINEILAATTRSEQYKNRILLNAPTGSGKTIISGGLIDLLFYNEPNSAVMWISPQPSLVEQSLDKFRKFYNLTTTFYRGDSLHEFRDGEVTGTNWEVIKNNMDTTNKVIHGTEQIKPLEEIVREYKSNGGKLYVFIDESHHNKEDSKNEKDKTRRILEILDADVEVFISATPQDIDERTTEVKIDINDVRNAGFIKQGIIINDIADDVQYNEKYRKENNVSNLTEFYVKESINKLKQLEVDLGSYAKSKGKETTVKPLLLINVPDSNNEDNKERIRVVINYLRRLGYNNHQGNLINLTNNGDKIDSKTEKSYKEQLSTLCANDKVEVVVFKQSIGMGWDCPRASVLTFIRDPKTTTLTTQVIGRILRMPYLSNYTGEEYDHLNYGYVYIQNDDNIILKNLVREIEQDTQSRVVYHKKTDVVDSALDHLPNQMWQVSMEAYDLNHAVKERLDGYDWESKLDLRIRTNKVETGTGKIDSVSIYEGDSELSITKRTLGRSSDIDMSNNIKETIRGYGLLEYETFIYTFMKDIGDRYGLMVSELLAVIHGNIHKILETIQVTVEGVKSDYKTHKKVNQKFQLPYYDVKETNKRELLVAEPNNYTHEKVYVGNELEKSFTEHLLRDSTVKWFYKNGDYGTKYFKMPYKLGGEHRLFFPDFLVEYDDKVVIYETKGQITTEENVQKVKAMEDYLREFPEVRYTDSKGNEVVKAIECYYVTTTDSSHNIFYKYIGKSSNYTQNSVNFQNDKTGWELMV